MPQINIYTFLSQTSWTIIIFFIFYYIMKQYLLPIIYEQLQLKYKLNNKINIQSLKYLSNHQTNWNSILNKITKE